MTGLAVGLIAAFVFAAWELHRRDAALLDVRLFRQRGLVGGSITLLAVYGVLAGIFVVFFPFFQAVLGWSGLLSTLALMPMAVLMMMTSGLALSWPRGSQPPAATSDTAAAGGGHAAQPPRPGKKATQIPPAYTTAYDAYARELSRPGGPLDADTVRAYLSRVRQFLAWLPSADTSGDPLADPAARDGAARGYRAFLLTVAKRKASTVNAHLTAIDDFFRHRGLGPAAAERQELPQLAPRALDGRELTRWLRAVERAPARDQALAFTELYAGTRGGETVSLDLGDLRTSARKGHLIVRYGKGGKYREVPLHPKLKTALDTWRTERAAGPAPPSTPRCSSTPAAAGCPRAAPTTSSPPSPKTQACRSASTENITPHTLRHTAGTIMVRSGEDIVTVAEILGHSLETARRYSLPTETDRHRATRRIPVDE